MNVLPECMCVYHMPGIHRGQRWVSDPQELELQVIVSHTKGSGNQTQTLCRGKVL